MMKNTAAVLVVLLMLTTFCCARTYSPLNETWSHPLKSDSISLVDANKDGLLEVFVASYGKHVSCIYSFDYGGKALGVECLPGYSKGYFSNVADEEFTLIRLEDMGRDGVVDMFASSYLVGNEINVQKFYIAQREYNTGLKRYEYNLKWQYPVDNVVTDVVIADADNDRRDEIIASSLDSSIYVLNQSRLLKRKIDLGSGVWSIAVSDLDGDNLTELVAGAFSGVYRLDARPPEQIFNMRWSYPTESRVFSVFASDVNGDGRAEITALSKDKLYLLDANGMLMWSKTVSDGVKVLIKDVDNNGDMDILVLAKGGVYAFDAQGGLRWQYPIVERGLTLAVDFYNNIFVGSEEKLYHFVANPDFVLNADAEESYLKAYNFYVSAEYAYATYHAARAKKMFEMVRNEDGIVKCDYILTLAGSNSTVVYRVVKAGEYYVQASELLAAKSFEEARSYAQLALDIYVEVKDKNHAVQCDVLLAKINSEELYAKRIWADDQYRKASDSLSKNLFEEASSQAQEASLAYSALNDPEGVAKSESLLSEIKLMDKLYTADSSYNLALVSQQSGDYSSALMYSEKARGLYVELGDASMVNASESLVNASGKYIEAESYYKLAMDMYGSSRLDNATVLAEKAKAIYLSMGDVKNAERCDFILSDIKSRKRESILNYLVLAIPIVFVVLIIVIRRRKAK
jgi:predicted nucleic acid-binding Zn ribbon protein